MRASIPAESTMLLSWKRWPECHSMSWLSWTNIMERDDIDIEDNVLVHLINLKISKECFEDAHWQHLATISISRFLDVLQRHDPSQKLVKPEGRSVDVMNDHEMLYSYYVSFLSYSFCSCIKQICGGRNWKHETNKRQRDKSNMIKLFIQCLSRSVVGGLLLLRNQNADPINWSFISDNSIQLWQKLSLAVSSNHPIHLIKHVISEVSLQQKVGPCDTPARYLSSDDSSKDLAFVTTWEPTSETTQFTF